MGDTSITTINTQCESPPSIDEAIAEFKRLTTVCIERLQERVAHEVSQGRAAQARFLKQREEIAELQQDILELRRQLEGSPPIAIRLALTVLLNHVEPGWENCKSVVQAWLTQEKT